MSRPIRFLTREDAEVMARNVVERTASRGCVEYAGLKYSSPALLDWENRQREMGKDSKVDVRIDELDLSSVYVDVPERGVGPFKALSRQPSFTDGLSLSELNRLKKTIKDKELADRIGRLADDEALKLRTEFYALLGRAHDPAALKRLTQLQDQLARQRLQQAGTESPPSTVAAPVDAKPRRPGKAPSSQTARTGDRPAEAVNATSIQQESPSAVISEMPATPANVSSDVGGLPPRKFRSINVKRTVA